MFNKLLLLVLIALTTITSYSQDSAWKNLNLPAGLSTDITTFASSGNDLYLGTNGQGVFYSNDSGNTWSNHSIYGQMTSGPINKILVSSHGYVFAVGVNSIFRTADKGSSWEILTNFPSTEGTIQCSAISPLGAIAIGTNTSIIISQAGDNGNLWRVISSSIGAIDARTIIFNQSEQIFVSGIYRTSPTIYLTDLSGRSFTKIVNNITEPPLINDFTLDVSGIMFAAVGSSIYQFDYSTSLWTLYTTSSQPKITRIKFAGNGYLLSFGDNSLRIFDPNSKVWLPDNPLLNFNDQIIDANVDNNNAIWIIHNKGIDLSNGSIDIIIRFILSKHFNVVDAKGFPMRNKTLALYKATCDNNQVLLENVKTDNQGGFYLNYVTYNLQSRYDQIKLEKKVFTENTVKTGHEEFGNKIDDIYLNNMEYDDTGNPGYYTITDDTIQTIIMGHTLIHRFLVVSCEWEAKPEYLDTLASWCKLMSEFLYDVTDGQLFVEGISIYDSKKKWDQADVRIFASDFVWPNSAVDGIHHPDNAKDQVRMPRRWYGDSSPSVNQDNSPDWFTINDRNIDLTMSSTMAHELGHYMLGFFDEYVWTEKNKGPVNPHSYNFGFMDYQYQDIPGWSSEMSDLDRYSNPDYRYTAQWTYNHSDCWTQFRNEFQRYYDDSGDQIWIPITEPTDRTLHTGYKYLLGPMDFQTGQNKCSIKPLVTVKIHHQNSGAGDFVFKIVGDDSVTAVPYANVNAYKLTSFNNNFYYIVKADQGIGAYDGSMIVVGANVNDRIDILKWIDSTQTMYKKSFIVDAVSGAKSNGDNTQSVPVIRLTPVKGVIRLINTMKYDTYGNIYLNVYTEKSFNSIPTVDFQINDTIIKNYNFNFDSKKSVYSLSLNDAINEEGTMMFNTMDSVNNPFSIPFDYRISNFGKNVFAPGGAAELIIDSSNTSIERISALLSNFPPLKNGIPFNAKQGGTVVSFSTAPGTLSPGTKNILNIRYPNSNLTPQEEASLNIFRWDENNLVWNKMQSQIDTTTRIVSAAVDSDGIYAAFATFITVGLLDENNNDYFSINVYPNPINTTSLIEFYLPVSGNTTLNMYNALGQEVRTFVNSSLGNGKHSYNFNSSQLESGVYYLTLKANNRIATKKVILIK
jgi:hypothetical protein